MRSSFVALCLAMAAAPVCAQTNALTLVKATDSAAIVRVDGALVKVHRGDRLDTPKALVREVARGRLVLEESFTGADGKPNRALIVIREGETGGTRYFQRPEKSKPSGTKGAPARPPRQP